MTYATLTPDWSYMFPHEAQRAAWTCPKRFVGLDCGRGSGKTELAKRKLVVSLTCAPVKYPARYFYGAPTEHQAKRIAWDHVLRLIPRTWLKPGGVHLGELYIETVFGSQLWIVGLDKPQRIEGDQWDGGVLDESCDLKPGVFDRTVLPMLAWRNGWCWRIGVPKRQGPSAAEFRKWCEQARESDIPERAAFNWPSADIVPPDTLAYAQQHLDKMDYLEQFCAVWQSAGGGVFHAFDRTVNVRPCAYDPTLPLIVGMDFNVDPMAWAIAHRRGKTLEWISELWQRNTNTPRALDTLYKRYSNHAGGVHFYPDASSASRKTSATMSDLKMMLSHPGFKKLGRVVHSYSTNPHIDDRFAACNAMLCNAADDVRMWFDPVGCPHTIEDFENRYYKPGTRDAADSGDLGHPSDAVGYAVARMFPYRLDIQVGGGKIHLRKPDVSTTHPVIAGHTRSIV